MSLENDDPQIGTSNEKVPLKLGTSPKWSLTANLDNNNKYNSNNNNNSSSNNNNNNNLNHQMNKLGNTNNTVTTNNNNNNNNNNNSSLTSNNNNINHNNNNRIMSKENNHKWAPLPQDEQRNNHNNPISISEMMDVSKIPENNNDWKNGWKDMPQNGNNNNSNTLGNGNSNGHSDKLAEQDPLTGQQRLSDLDELSSCGIGSCRPKWARCFATTHVFMVVFLLAWVLQGMYYTYFVSVITTIEKLFQIKSKITGMLMSATEIGQISTSLFLTYYAGRGHRPRWIACGMILFAISSFGCTLPHFIYGDELLHASNVFQGQSAGSIMRGNTTVALTQGNINLCIVGNNASNLTCLDSIKEEQSNHTKITNIVLIIFAISLLGVGVGQTAVSTLGIPYIDDNVASRESPIYIAITIGVRILGPAFGFILGSFCTRIYVDFSMDPKISPTDPGWVGAWWLGLVLVSSFMGVTSIAMFTFPRHLRGNRIPAPAKLRAIEDEKKKSEKEEEPKAPKLKDFPKTIKRQLRNDILMFRTASSVLHLLPVAGLYTFLPKYMETQFRLPAHDANLISGIGGILVMGVGIVISGIVILKFSPTARSVAAWIAFAALIYSCGMAVLMFIGCPMDDFKGLKLNNPAPLPKFEPVCNTTCECDTRKFSPICGSDGMTYFSSCHAGCSESIKNKKGKLVFKNCQCIPESFENPELMGGATSGYCDGNCKKFIMFISIFSFLVFVHSTSEVGSMLLIMRCTDPKDKAMAMGVIQFAIGLFGNVPCPIIYGAVVDSACLVWETVCGKQGACSLYDGDVFRHFFLGTTSGIMFLAFIVDLVVWHKAHRIDIDPEANSENEYEKTTIVPDTNV